MCKTIGDRIKRKREEMGLSQQDLADRLGYKSRSSINKIELGVYNLTQSKIKAVADALGTSVNYVMGWDDQENVQPHIYDEDAMDLAEFLYQNPDYRDLFKTCRKVKREDLQFVQDLIDRMQR